MQIIKEEPSAAVYLADIFPTQTFHSMLVYCLGEMTKIVLLIMVFQFMHIPILMVVILIKENLIRVIHKKILEISTSIYWRNFITIRGA